MPLPTQLLHTQECPRFRRGILTVYLLELDVGGLELGVFI
ncbi:hypothetical protein M2120_000974 [Aurantimicrobium minutum]|nr:hypothetical protein [Aurantimicrobium minutum]